MKPPHGIVLKTNYNKVPITCLAKSGEAAFEVVENKRFGFKKGSSPGAETVHSAQQALSTYLLSEWISEWANPGCP